MDNLWLKNIPKGTASEKLVNLATKYPKLSGFIGGTMVSIVFTIALEILWYYINKDLFICARIYNWDTRTWEVDDWYHDNGILVGDKEFEKKPIPASARKIHDSVCPLYTKQKLTFTSEPMQKTPWGPKLGKWKPAEFVEYNFQNSTFARVPSVTLSEITDAPGYLSGFTVLDGIGIALRARSIDNKNGELTALG